MIISLVRNMSISRIKYCVNGFEQIDSEANCTYTMLPQVLKVSDGGNTKLMLKQNNLLLRLFDALPIINLFRFTPYTFISNNVACGKLTKAQIMPAYTLAIGEDTYEIRLHNNDICTLTKNSTVVAKYRKDKESFMEKNSYTIEFEDSSKEQLCFYVLICMFIDVTFYANHMTWSAYKKESNYVFDDQFAEQAKWKPQ